MEKLDLALNILSFSCAYIAAFLWLKSAAAKVPHIEGDGGTGNPEIIVDGYKFIESAKLQARLSAKAAVFAGFSAIFQGCSILLGTLLAT